MTAALRRFEAIGIAALRTLLGLGLVAMVLLNVANAAGRYGGLPTLTGADELLVFAMIWIVMLGAILATRERSHLAIDLAVQHLHEKARRAVGAVIGLVTVAASGFIAWHSADFVERIAAIGQKSMGLGIPMIIPHLAITVGFSGIAVVAGVLVAGDLARLRSGSGE